MSEQMAYAIKQIVDFCAEAAEAANNLGRKDVALCFITVRLHVEKLRTGR